MNVHPGSSKTSSDLFLVMCMSSSVDTGIKDGVFDVDNWISANGQINSLEICAYFGMHMWS